MTTKTRHWSGRVFIATSLDGYIAEPDGDLDWLTDPPPETRHAPAHQGLDAPPDYEAFTAGVSHLVMGRGTYEKVLTFYPWPYERFRVIVLSTSLEEGADPNVQVAATIDDACALLDHRKRPSSTSTAARSSRSSWPGAWSRSSPSPAPRSCSEAAFPSSTPYPPRSDSCTSEPPPPRPA